MPTRLIGFCYAFMVGIACSMAWPILGRFVPWWSAAALACLVAALFMAVRHADTRRALALRMASLLAFGVLTGVVRHASVDRRPDERLGTLSFGTDTLRFEGSTRERDAARLRLRKEGQGSATVRLSGVLRSRVPVLDASGTPAMDSQGRWRFRELVQPQLSGEIVIGEELALGAEIDIDVPFSEITNAVRIAGSAGLRLGVLRASNHLAAFARPGRGIPPSTILGRIEDDPAVYGNRTVLTLTPAFLQAEPGGPFFRITDGKFRVTTSPGVPGYDQVARTDAIGNDVVVFGELQTPQAAANPDAFDNRRYLANYGVYGQMMLWVPRSGDSVPPLRVVAPDGGTPRSGNAVVMFSLRLRDRMLRVLKQTLPYPHSAFAGGVTLGLRYGLQGTECLLSPSTPQQGLAGLQRLHSPCSDFISEEFRRSGVNHVLAVSGLHVTIITLMLVGIFNALKLSRRAFVPVIILALVVFTIITGARPSTLRAVIMNSLFLLTWAYLAQTLRSSVLLGVPIAAFLILVQNPAILVDPSFTLSFGAILSLALLTGPCHTVLCRFRGNDLLVLGALVVGFHLVIAQDWMLITSAFSVLLLCACTAALFALGRWAAQRGLQPLGQRGFGDLPTAVNGFIAAQFAIQLGMMLPMSSYYFARWPVAGAAANVIAIPLIGVVLQLAMLACLVGLVPTIGLPLALLLNAANWVFSTVFVLIAHYAAAWFPYPFARKPSGFGLAVYYAGIALFVGWARLLPWLRGRTWWRRPVPRYALIAACAVVALLALPRPPRADGKTRITFLAVNYGSSVLVQTPSGRNILIDGGYRLRDRNRAVEAERNVLPYLCRLGIRDLDAVVVLSARPERLDGIAPVLTHCRVAQLVLPPGVAAMFDAQHRLVPTAVSAALPDGNTSPTATEARTAIAGPKDTTPWWSLAEVLAKRRPTAFNRLTGRAVRIVAGRPGQTLLPERTPAGDFAVSLLAPTDAELERDVLRNGSLALRISHGAFAALFTGDLDYDGIARLMATQDPSALAADVLVAPARGIDAPRGTRANDPRFAGVLRARLDDILGVLLQTSKVRHAVFEFGNPRPVLKDGRDALRAYEVAKRWYEERLGPAAVVGTDTHGAVFVVSDGTTYELSTLADRQRLAADGESAMTLSEATFF